MVLKKEIMEEEDEYAKDGETESKDKKNKETHQIFKLEVPTL